MTRKFKVGDKVVYPHHGARSSRSRETKEAFGEKREYLVLRLAYGDLTLMVPVDNTDGVGLREVINDEEVEEVFAGAPQEGGPDADQLVAALQEPLREAPVSGDIYQVAEVVRNLSIRDKDKGLSAGEKRMLSRARQILVSELTFALAVDEATAEQRLNVRPAVVVRHGRVVVAAGGSGSRFGEPKQFVHSRPPGGRAIRGRVPSRSCDGRAGRAGGRPTTRHGRTRGRGWRARSASVRAGLAALRATSRSVVVHDAARPLARPELFGPSSPRSLTSTSAGAVPGVAVSDTVKRVQGRDRARSHRDAGPVRVVAVQTPQAFRVDALRRAHDRASTPPTTPRWSRRSVAGWWSCPARPRTESRPRSRTSPPCSRTLGRRDPRRPGHSTCTLH